jgi:transposase/IS5 family transposase
MSGHFQTSDRDAVMLLAPDLQDWLPRKHLARFVVECVERLDLRAIEASYAGCGKRAYRPKVLLALLIYGYATGVYSSRKIERATFDSVAFRFIAANTSPDHDTIADFRRRVLSELPRLFLAVLQIARELGCPKFGQISLDGTKMKANASKHRALSYAYAGKIAAKLRREIKRLLALAEQADNEKSDEGFDIPAEVARREDLIASIDAARAKIEKRERERHDEIRAKHKERLAQRRELAEKTGEKPRGKRPRMPKLRINPKAQINLTDEESRVMPAADGFVQGYNAQAGVAHDSQFIVYASVTQATNDKEQITDALAALKELPPEVAAVSDLVADTGYFSKDNVEACEAADIRPSISMNRERHHSWLDRKLEAGLEMLPESATPVEKMRARMRTESGRELYSNRKTTVEPVFGNIKTAMGIRGFLLRGFQKVSGEWQLICMAFNMRKAFGLTAS